MFKKAFQKVSSAIANGFQKLKKTFYKNTPSKTKAASKETVPAQQAVQTKPSALSSNAPSAKQQFQSAKNKSRMRKAAQKIKRKVQKKLKNNM